MQNDIVKKPAEPAVEPSAEVSTPPAAAIAPPETPVAPIPAAEETVAVPVSETPAPAPVTPESEAPLAEPKPETTTAQPQPEVPKAKPASDKPIGVIVAAVAVCFVLSGLAIFGAATGGSDQKTVAKQPSSVQAAPKVDPEAQEVDDAITGSAELEAGQDFEAELADTALGL